MICGNLVFYVVLQYVKYIIVIYNEKSLKFKNFFFLNLLFIAVTENYDR